MDLDRVRQRFPDRGMVWLDSTGSTMDEASRRKIWLVGAEMQTSGKGRLGRNWHSEPGCGLYFTLTLPLVRKVGRAFLPAAGLPPSLDPADVPALTLTLGIAVYETIQRSCGLPCDLRWPNDLLIGGKKCAGILVQYEPPAFLAGIGLNVNQTAFPEAFEATSLLLASGRQFPREDLLVDLLLSIDTWCRTLSEHGRESILRRFEECSTYARGKHVIVDPEGERREGVTAGLDPSGFLILERPNGKRELIMAGGVRPA